MVIELLSKPGFGGGDFSLAYVAENLDFKPWSFVECHPELCLYPVAFPKKLRNAMSQGKLRLFRCPPKKAAALCQTLLESSLCGGVFLHGLDDFTRAQPAAIWGRRWQLAAQKGNCSFLWLHQKTFPVIGFSVRLEWKDHKHYLIKKGHQHIEKFKFTAA